MKIIQDVRKEKEERERVEIIERVIKINEMVSFEIHKWVNNGLQILDNITRNHMSTNCKSDHRDIYCPAVPLNSLKSSI